MGRYSLLSIFHWVRPVPELSEVTCFHAGILYPMHKVFLGLVLSILLLSSTVFSATKPVDTCGNVSNLYYLIAVERDKGVLPIDMANRIWDKVEDGSLTKEQAAHMLMWTIEVYSSSESPQTIKDKVHAGCMKALGKVKA